MWWPHSTYKKTIDSLMKREVIITNDGSSSLSVTNWGENFHSIHGALQESVHVYINNGLALVEKEEISVLEFGFGTGLNALLSFEFAQKNNKKLHYEAIEAYPLSKDEYLSLNFDAFIKSNISVNDIHDCEWNQLKTWNNMQTFLKHSILIEDFVSNKQFDVVYFDVFGYDYQPELWSKAILEKAYQLLKPKGIFVTYACKGVVNRTLKELGFTVHKVAGPPGKREMIFAVK